MFPAALERAVANGLTRLRSDAAHHLDRPHRLSVYVALGAGWHDRPAARRTAGWERRALLDLQAAERVLPVWIAQASQTGRSVEDLDLPRRWLEEARQALTLPPPSRGEAGRAIGYTWGQAEVLSSGAAAGPFVLVVVAAQKALARALNDLGFNPERADWDLTDARTYPSYWDAAFCASCASVAGFPWDAADAVEVAGAATRRRAYWEWWLTEAVLQAWAAVHDE
jgi:hypothetical protein